jgi:single-stranded-DNA-specific exonuclease
MQGLRKSADLLQQFGGHAMAAGCAFAATNFETVRERMAADVSASVPPGELRPTLMADLRVQQGQLSLGLVESLRALEPHGQGNPEPAFLLENVSLRNTRTVGRDASHLQGFIGNAKLIGFGLGRFTGLTASSKVDLVGRLGIDTWNGTRNVQLMVDDMRIANPL